MNLETHIRSQLWLAIKDTYEAENYTHAILDAIHCLTNMLREKSGLDGDGQSLVGKALGGNSPILRINKFQTESEKDTQKGLEQLLRGLYQGIRNPRSHEQIQDTKTVADAIIHFINYLLDLLEQSREPFTVQEFITKVFDPHFVPSKRYAELLASEIPQSKLMDTVIEIYRAKSGDMAAQLEYTMPAIMARLSDEQIAAFLAVVSDELRVTRNETEVRINFQILPPNYWPRLNEAARLRIENMVIKSISEGAETDDIFGNRGAFGTWSRDFLKHFGLKYQVRDALIKKLKGDFSEQLYALSFFGTVLHEVCIVPYQQAQLVVAIAEAVRSDETGKIKDILSDIVWNWPEDWRNSLNELVPNAIPLDNEEEDIPF